MNMDHPHSRAGTARAVAALAALLLASGCGMYGDLYLEAPPPPAPQPAPEVEVEEREPSLEDTAPAVEPTVEPADEDPAEKPKQAPPDGGEQATGRP
jgi:predicted small lipoprotein YifL